MFAFISSDYPKAAIGYVDEGLIGGIRVVDACGTGKLVVQKFLDAWAGRPVARNYTDGSRIVTGEEFKRLVAQGGV